MLFPCIGIARIQAHKSQVYDIWQILSLNSLKLTHSNVTLLFRWLAR